MSSFSIFNVSIISFCRYFFITFPSSPNSRNFCFSNSSSFSSSSIIMILISLSSNLSIILIFELSSIFIFLIILSLLNEIVISLSISISSLFNTLSGIIKTGIGILNKNPQPLNSSVLILQIYFSGNSFFSFSISSLSVLLASIYSRFLFLISLFSSLRELLIFVFSLISSFNFSISSLTFLLTFNCSDFLFLFFYFLR